MSGRLSISAGHYSGKGRKTINQDSHGISIPKEPQLSAKGIVIALADGISSSDVSQIASQAAISGFLQDYYCTSDAWSVKKSAHRVLLATNSWLYAQTRQSHYRFEKDRGYACTFSALILKSTTAHIFHVGDTRIYRISGDSLEQLTKDHRYWVSPEQSYLSRALGIDSHLEIDYQSLPLVQGDTFLLATDGVYEFTDAEFIIGAIAAASDLDSAAKVIAGKAYDQGSPDNLTIQIVRIAALPRQEADEHYQRLNELPLPPLLSARMDFDGFTIIRELHASSRSHVYLAVDNGSKEQVVLKIPAIDSRDDPAYLERFLMEEWIARRINSPHVLKPCAQNRKRSYLYSVTEFLDGQTLTQWMRDNPKPTLETVRGIVEQIAKGLRAFHRLEMLHQDLRPENIMIDANGLIKLIDFGAVSVAGLLETNPVISHHIPPGTAQYSAPECLLGESGTAKSDLFSLGVITYQLLTGKLPYGVEVAKCKTKAGQNQLSYDDIRYVRQEIPAWVDDAIKKAVNPNPNKRYEELSEYLYDLRYPNRNFLNRNRTPLLERNPMAFWRGLALLQTLIILLLLMIINS
jgi:serine/threonine protein phosphatase PrpC